MRANFRFPISALAIGICFAATATRAAERPPRGVAPGVEKPLLIAPRPENGRNSEGDFIQLKDGRLLLVYSKFIGTGDHAPAELVGRYSADGGRTWGRDDIQVIALKPGEANLMSVSLLRLQDDRIALFYVQKYNSPPDSKYPYLDYILMRTSADEGLTWSEPTYVVPKDEPGYRVLNNDRVVQLKTGRLVVPLAVHYLPGWPKWQDSAQILCYLSDDHGQTWRPSKSTLQSELLAQEPGVVQLKDDGLLMFCRSRDCQLVSRSDDGGDTWSTLKRSNISQPTASPASIERIPATGHLLLVWNNGDDPLAAAKPVGRRPFSAAISKDEGATWQYIQNLGTDPQGWYCYTAIEFVEDHVLLAHCEYPGLNSLQVTRLPVSWLYKSTTAANASNPIQLENQHPGARDWQLTRVRLDAGGFRSPWIEGYCSRQSVKAGETFDILVSTNPVRQFKAEIFRMGYYGGRGARLMKTVDSVPGKLQPDPVIGKKNLHECRWSPSLQLTIPDDWLSGVYLGRLTTKPDGIEAYWQSYVVFIVTDDRPADVLFQCSDNTWQAYNRWPNNYSVYTHPKGNQGPWADVSFDRPYGREAQYTGVVNDPLTVGSGEFLPLEFPLSYWLEQHGYDVAYCSNSDMLTPERGLKCKAFVSIGHDEYWDIRQFNSAVSMRDAGVNMLFFSGNSVCWVTPFRQSASGHDNRIIFRGGPYGADNQYAVDREKDHGPFPHRGPDEGLLMGARNIEPVNGGGDWVVAKADHWMFEGTDLNNGDSIPGLIGWEYHGQPADIEGLQIVGAGTAWQGGVNPQQWTATIYPGPKNNFVFNAATIFWAQAVSSPPGHTLPWSHWSRPHGPDDRVQRITKNLFDRSVRKNP